MGESLQVRISPWLLADRAHGSPVVAIVEVPIHAVRNEEEVVRVDRVALVERRGPVVAVGTDTVDRRTVA